MSDKKDIHESQYNYPHFRPDLMVERFEGGPNPGETAPDFTAVSLNGEKIRLSDFRGRRHVVLQFGSVT
jgi:peroxiredoxin